MAAKQTQAKPAAAKAPETKLGTFLASKKIDARRVIAASHKLETLQPEDRALRLSRRRAKAAEGGDAAAKDTRKPRSGRPVTPRAIAAALAGKPVSGPTKHRIVRAVNHLLEQKKAEKIDIRALF